jgi:hypothetical protein
MLSVSREVKFEREELRSREISGSSHSSETSYHDWVFRDFPQSFEPNVGIVT